MADPSPSSSTPAAEEAAAPLSPSKKENVRPIDSKITVLNQSQAELVARLQGLKLELQNWRLKLGTQVKTYKEELAELKKTLNTDMEQLKSEFQNLRTTLQQQQDDVTSRLKDLGMQDVPKDGSTPESNDVDQSGKAEEKTEEVKGAALDMKEPDSADT